MALKLYSPLPPISKFGEEIGIERIDDDTVGLWVNRHQVQLSIKECETLRSMLRDAIANEQVDAA